MPSVKLKRVEAWRNGYKRLEYEFSEDGAVKNLAGWTFKLRAKPYAAGEAGAAETWEVAHDAGESDLANGIVVFILTSTQLTTSAEYICGADWNDGVNSSQFHKFKLDVIADVTDIP